jgi:hypothetical protein
MERVKRKYTSFYLTEEQKNLRLSGHAYVPAVSKDLPVRRFKLKIAAPHLCDHETTVCIGRLPKNDNSLASLIRSGITCVESWELDHELLFERTAGGRRLREKSGKCDV